jgi:hypothetical protein
MMESYKSLRRVGAVFVVVSAAIAAALVGGASSGRAATDFRVMLTPLLGTVGNEIPQVSYGGKIGYHLKILNNDTSNTQHASVVVTSDLATFKDDDSDSASCKVNPNDAHQMVCARSAARRSGTDLRGKPFHAPATTGHRRQSGRAHQSPCRLRQ